MLRLPRLALLFVAACGGTHRGGMAPVSAPVAPATKTAVAVSTNAPPPPRERPPGDAERCVRAIRALSEGNLRGWHGLPAGCTKEDAMSVLAFDRTEEQLAWWVGNQSAPTRVAPHGVRVNLELDEIAYLSIAEPRLGKQTLDALGHPDGTIETRLQLAGAREQRVYAKRGLALHVGSKGVTRLYAFGATTLDAFRDSALARVTIRKEPLRF